MTKEKRVYVIDCDDDFEFREAELEGNYNSIMDKAEELGTVYSLRGFQNAVNNDEVNLSNSFIYISNLAPETVSYLDKV